MNAALVLVTRERRVLAVWEPRSILAGWWALPGGVVEEGETAHHAARRELREETGLELLQPRPFARYLVDYPSRGRGTLHVYLGDVGDQALRPEQGSEAAWIDPAEERLHPTVQRILRDAGLRETPLEKIDQALAGLGIAMRSLYDPSS